MEHFKEHCARCNHQTTVLLPEHPGPDERIRQTVSVLCLCGAVIPFRLPIRYSSNQVTRGPTKKPRGHSIDRDIEQAFGISPREYLLQCLKRGMRQDDIAVELGYSHAAVGRMFPRLGLRYPKTFFEQQQHIHGYDVFEAVYQARDQVEPERFGDIAERLNLGVDAKTLGDAFKHHCTRNGIKRPTKRERKQNQHRICSECNTKPVHAKDLCRTCYGRQRQRQLRKEGRL